MNIKTISLFSALACTLLLVCGVWYVKSDDPIINCSGAVIWDIRNEKFNGDVTYKLHNGQGIVTLTGQLKGKNMINYKISRVVYLTYYIKQQNYITTTYNLIRYPTDELPGAHETEALPKMYLSSGASFSFTVKKYREGWSFTTVGSSSLLCSNLK